MTGGSLNVCNLPSHLIQIEYEVKACESSRGSANACIDIKKKAFIMPKGGYLIYGVAHQHSGGVGSSLYGEVFVVFVCNVITFVFPLLAAFYESQFF